MTDKQWVDLQDIVGGKILSPLPVGFIIDSPWLPNWYGVSILDYFSSDQVWLETNLKAIETYPEVMLLPGFWSEYGMCSEPSAFGTKSSFPENEFPHAFPNITSVEQIVKLEVPSPEKDGLGPFILKRLKMNQPQIEKAGHRIRFSISRGPLNIASYLMGTTEFMMALMTNPQEVHELIGKITTYLVAFHDLQQQLFPSVEGILMLDDIIGFISEDQFVEFGFPYFREIYDRDLKIKFLHNDANCMESVKYLPDMGVNLFNMGFDTDMNQLKELTRNRVTMLGNIPPRDVLARGTTDDVRAATEKLLKGMNDHTRVIYSCGGGMPPGVKDDNLKAFVETVKNFVP